jgi:hypothetical protein
MSQLKRPKCPTVVLIPLFSIIHTKYHKNIQRISVLHHEGLYMYQGRLIVVVWKLVDNAELCDMVEPSYSDHSAHITLVAVAHSEASS